jgi:thioester reductase-like protein
MLAGCIQVGVAPDIKNSMDMTPVNYVAAAMVYLSRQRASVGKVFHLLNPSPIHWSDIFDMVIAEGYPVRKLPFNEWVEAVEERADPQKNVLYPLLPFFQITFARRMLGVENSHYFQLGTTSTQAAMNGSGLTCPKIDRKLIHTFLQQLASTGRLESTLAV